MITKKSELEAYRASQQRDFLRKESEIYKQVYLETQDMVQKYANAYQYTLIMRFNRSSVEDAENPQEVIQSMNRQVVYHKKGDDITDPVLRGLERSLQANRFGSISQAPPETPSARAGLTCPCVVKLTG